MTIWKIIDFLADAFWFLVAGLFIFILVVIFMGCAESEDDGSTFTTETECTECRIEEDVFGNQEISCATGTTFLPSQ